MAQAEMKIQNFTWHIPKTKHLFENEISLRSQEFSTEISSSEFIQSGTTRSLFEVKWRLQMTTKVEPDLTEQSNDKEIVKDNYIALYLRNTNYIFQRLSILQVTFFICDSLKRKMFCKSQTLFEILKGQHYGFWNFISIEEFQKFQLDELIIYCEIEEVKKDFKFYESFFCNESCSDVDLHVDNDIYPCHKLILAVSSLTFREKFSLQESISHLKIEDVEPKVFDVLLKYIYTGKINRKTMYPELFTAATNYEIWGLMIISKRNLSTNLKVENVIPTLMACKKNELRFEVDDLIQDCKKFINYHFNFIMCLELWKDLVKTEPKLLVEIFIDFCSNLESSQCKRKEKLTNDLSGNSFSYYETFLNNETFSDIEIHVGDEKFHAHKIVLAARSPVFNRMFSHNMKETISKIVEIEDLEPKVFSEVLRFMYTNKIQNVSFIREIVIAADKYEIQELNLKCAFLLGEKLRDDNLCDTFFFADDFNVKETKEICINYIIDNICFKKRVDYLENLCSAILRKSRAHLILELMKEIASNRCEILLCCF